MEIKNPQLVIVMLGVTVIVAAVFIDLIVQYQRDETFRQKWPFGKSAGYLHAIAPQLIDEEFNVPLDEISLENPEG